MIQISYYLVETTDFVDDFNIIPYYFNIYKYKKNYKIYTNFK